MEKFTAEAVGVSPRSKGQTQHQREAGLIAIAMARTEKKNALRTKNLAIERKGEGEVKTKEKARGVRKRRTGAFEERTRS